jgi:hypothetical protein
MANQPTVSVFQQLRRMVAADRAGGQTDTLMLERLSPCRSPRPAESQKIPAKPTVSRFQW